MAALSFLLEFSLRQPLQLQKQTHRMWVIFETFHDYFEKQGWNPSDTETSTLTFPGTLNDLGRAPIVLVTRTNPGILVLLDALLDRFITTIRCLQYIVSTEAYLL